MAIRRPIIWNPTLRVFEQLQPGDGIDVGSVTTSFSDLLGPKANTTLDLDGYDITFIGATGPIFKLLPDSIELSSPTTLGDGTSSSYNHQFFKTLTTYNAVPTTFAYQKTTRCLRIQGTCHSFNASTNTSDVFEISCYLIGSGGSVVSSSANDQAIVPIIQQNGTTITFSVVGEVITFNVIGVASSTIEWNMYFDITELG